MKLHLGCGDDHRDGYVNVDARDTAAADEVVDLDRTPWPWPDDSATEIVAEHVVEHLASVEAALRECARILQPGGRLTVAWPVGMDERADPDHKHRWVWDTPTMYCGARPWDVDVGLTVVDREVTVGTHLHGALGLAYGGAVAVARHLQPDGRWLFDLPATSGEFRVVFEA